MLRLIFTIIITLAIVLMFLYFKAASQQVIYVYNDDGTSQYSFENTTDTLSKVVNKKYKIASINSEEIISGELFKNAKMLVIPGGADIYYAKKLNGLGNENIKKFVINGGSYLGICAGAYYGSNTVEFDKNGKNEVRQERELKFFPGKAIGPVLAEYDYKSNSGARAASVGVNLNVIKEPKLTSNIRLYYNGGCYFENAQNHNSVESLAWYDADSSDKFPAIIYTNFGSGKVVLSGVHFEYNADILDQNDLFLKNVIPMLTKDDNARLLLTSNIMKLLKVDTLF